MAKREGVAGAPAVAPDGRASTDPFREWPTLTWWDYVDYETECSRPTVTTRTVPAGEQALVTGALARTVVVLDRATQSLRALE